MKEDTNHQKKEGAKTGPTKRQIRHKMGAEKTEKAISNRILILALLIVALFGGLWIRLIDIQALNHTTYLQKQDDYTSIKQYTSAPRGQIYDVKGRVLAHTVPAHHIVYTMPNNIDAEDCMLYADRVGEVFHFTLDEFSLSELKDAYLRYTSQLDPSDPAWQGYDLLSEEEYAQYQSGIMSASTLRQTQLKNLDYERIETADERKLIACAIYNRMIQNASSGQASVIREDVDDEDAAYLIEHKIEFPGFDVDFNGWKREYPYGESLSDILGSVSTSTEGLPETLAEEYLAKGYQYNAQVGKSGLEYQYNDILTGTEEIAKITYDSNGLAKKEILQPAVKGRDLYLSIDIDLQQTLDQTLKTTLSRYGGTANRQNFYSLFMCMEDPQTGDVLAISGYQMNPTTRQLSYFASGNYTNLVNPGSCVKGVSVYMGQSEGVLEEGEVIYDARLNVGGRELGSFRDHGPVSDVSALSVSSNVYMFHIAMRLAGFDYAPGKAFEIEDVEGTIEKMRQYYSLFGLGNVTGIDVPGEVSVYSAGKNEEGMILNYVIGQLDTYTPLQMMQYAGVIASNGKMYQPHFYQYAKEVNSDEIFDVQENFLKSVLPEENASHLSRVQEGFAACVVDGNCGTPLQKMSHNMAAKTGTAEVGEWTTANLIGYGPVENPTVAYACSAPTSSVNSQNVSGNICTTDVVGPVLDKYFELYPQ